MARPAEEFASLYGDAAARAGNALGVDPRVLLGQWGLETGWGRSIIPGTNNLGNIKDLSGGGVAATDNLTGGRDNYRSYESTQHFADDYAGLIRRKYPDAIGAGVDLGKFTNALVRGGYAEDPRYAEKVSRAAEMAARQGAASPQAGQINLRALIPSANAGLHQASRRTDMAKLEDAPSQDWDLLAQKFSAGSPSPGAAALQPAQSSAADPWAELTTKFAQPAATSTGKSEAALPARTLSAAEGNRGVRIQNAARLLPIVGPLMNGVAGEGPERQAGKGVLRGLADVGDTLINAGAKGAAMLLPGNAGSALTAWNDERGSALRTFDVDNASSAYSGGRLLGNVAATAPVGGAIGSTFRAAASLPLIGRAASVLNPMANAIASGGFRTGLAPTGMAGHAGNAALRAAGGAVTGAASAGLVDPDSAGTGALIGGLLPGTFSAFSKAGDLVGRGINALRTPGSVRIAETVLGAGGITAPADIAAARAALAQQGPSILGEPLTAPQILRNPGISQLQRTLRNAGDTNLLLREQAQEAARRAALDRVSPVTGTTQQAADNFGNALAPEVRVADEAARKQVESAFESVDPFDESRFLLPIGQMKAAQEMFLGRGTFGAGTRAQTAIDTARNIGEETIGAISPAQASTARAEETLVQAVRRAGGINSSTPSGQQLAGELHDLRQTPGLRGIVANGRGESIDRLAQRMHQQGFLPDDDPATLLNHLRDRDLSSGHGHFADADRAYQALREAAQGDVPGAVTIARPVPFREVQNLRSSIGEAHAEAVAKGRTREAAALDRMRREIDSAVDGVASGRGAPDERFPADMVATWRDALAQHTDRMQRYRTGPAASIFRGGGDGLPAAQGGELAPKFFSPRGSQSEDIAAFGRLASPETTDLLKNYAVSDLASQSDALGNLSQAKVGNWMDKRSGALIGLFGEPERATLGAVRSSLDTAAANTRLGMGVGSNTAQNAQSALQLGLLDSRALGMVANRVPLIGQFTGPMLNALKESAKRSKVNQLGSLLADPVALERAIAEAVSRSSTAPRLPASGSELLPLLLRSAPALSSGQ